MTHGKFIQGNRGRRLARPIRYFVTGFVLFCLVAGPGLVCPEPFSGLWSTSAQAQIQVVEQLDGVAADVFARAIAGNPHGLMTLLSLGLAFASLFTLNLWIARHVRQVHATYRRRR